MIGISGSLIWQKPLMELIFNPCGEFQCSPEGPVSRIYSPYLHACAPEIFSDAEREWGVDSNGKLPHLFIPSKTATLVPEFAVKDLPLGRKLMIYKSLRGVFKQRVGCGQQREATAPIYP